MAVEISHQPNITHKSPRLFFGLNRESIDNFCATGILGLVLAILVFAPVATGAVRPLEFLVVVALTMAVLVLWLVRLWAGLDHRFLWPPLNWAVLAFAVYAVGRYLEADIEYVARIELLKVLVYASLFFAVLTHLHRQESVQMITVVLVFLAMAIAIYAGYQFITKSPYVWHFLKPDIYLKRGTGTFICPNHLAGFLEMILPVGLAWLFLGKSSPATKVCLGYACLVILAGIGVSISRGGWIATGITLTVLLVFLLRSRRYRLPAILLLGILITGLIVFIWKAEHSRVRFRSMFVSGRLEDIRFRLWKPALEMWQDHPWFGVGPAHFDYRFRQYRPEDVQMRPDRSHNDYFNTLADWGTVGAVLVGIPWILVYVGAFRTWKFVRRSAREFSSKSSNKSAFVLGSSLGLLAILLHSWVDFNMHIPSNAILAVCLMALLASHIRFATDGYWHSSIGAWRWIVSVVILGLLFFLGSQEIRLGKEYWWLPNPNVRKANEFDPGALPSLEKAFAVEPHNFQTAYNIGETLRIQSWQGEGGYAEVTRKAMQWFEKSIALNPYYGYSYLRYGMCLDWLGRSRESQSYYDQAFKLDPNGYYTVAHVGWHLVQLGDYSGAKPWFERSLRLKNEDNRIATTYLRIVERRLKDYAPTK